MAKNKSDLWIERAVGKNPGGLHKSLGVPQGQKIPTAKITKAAQGTGKVAKQANLAKTLSGFKKNKV